MKRKQIACVLFQLRARYIKENLMELRCNYRIISFTCWRVATCLIYILQLDSKVRTADINIYVCQI